LRDEHRDCGNHETKRRKERDEVATRILASAFYKAQVV
jgi:hypothetical protein